MNTSFKNLLIIIAIPVKLAGWAYFFLYKQYFTWLLERKVKRANRLSKDENRRYIVTNLWGRPRCIAKQNLKAAIKKRQFKKGVTIEDIEKHAYYITK